MAVWVLCVGRNEKRCRQTERKEEKKRCFLMKYGLCVYESLPVELLHKVTSHTDSHLPDTQPYPTMK